MEVLELFPTEVFVFKNSKIDNQRLIAELDRLDKIQIKKTSTLSMIVDLRSHPEFKELFAWFNQCLNSVKDYMKYDCDSLEITSTWFNVALAEYQMFQNVHRHSMSMWSAVYYLSDGSPTEFEDPVIHRTQAQLEVLRFDYNPFHRINAEPGKLVLFPSWLYHSSLPHLGNKNRYIISFNTLPNGKINHNLATDSKATVRIINDQ